MDTYKENGLAPEPASEENEHIIPQQMQPDEEEVILVQNAPTEQPALEECSPEEPVLEVQDEGFYHGTGAGIKESTLAASQPPREKDASSTEPAQEPAPPKKPKRKNRGIGRAILKYSILSVLVLALVATGCGISISVMNQYWKAYNQTMLNNFEQQIQVLRQELDAYKKDSTGTVIIPNQGLTPAQIYEDNIDSVVAVNCVIRTTNSGQVYEAQTSGSGFVLSSDGYIVTNYHVIETATSISVIFADGRNMSAQLVGGDATNDIALLKVEANNLQPVKVGSSDDLCVGDQVIAIGNALGELSFSLTVGYISGTDRMIATDGSIMNMLQTDASINSGNSGGPLFNAWGEVVGITTAKYSGTTTTGASIEGISFAIPMDDVIGMLEDLRQYGYITGVYLGVMVQDIDPAVAEMYGFPVGAYVREVTPGYCADRAGLQARDIITNIGGYTIKNMSDLKRVLREFEAGDQTTICVWRSGRKLIFNIVFDEKPRT